MNWASTATLTTIDWMLHLRRVTQALKWNSTLGYIYVVIDHFVIFDAFQGLILFFLACILIENVHELVPLKWVITVENLLILNLSCVWCVLRDWWYCQRRNWYLLSYYRGFLCLIDEWNDGFAKVSAKIWLRYISFVSFKSLISWKSNPEMAHLKFLCFSWRRGFPNLMSPSLSPPLSSSSLATSSFFEYRKGKRKIRFLNCVLRVVETATSVVFICPRWPFGSKFLRFSRRVN